MLTKECMQEIIFMRIIIPFSSDLYSTLQLLLLLLVKSSLDISYFEVFVNNFIVFFLFNTNFLNNSPTRFNYLYRVSKKSPNDLFSFRYIIKVLKICKNK